MLPLSLKAAAVAASLCRVLCFFLLKILPLRIATFWDRVLSLSTGACEAGFVFSNPKGILLSNLLLFYYMFKVDPRINHLIFLQLND